MTESWRRILGDEGYEVATANSGLSGLTNALYHDFDLVMVDLKMPGLDGLGQRARFPMVINAESLRKERPYQRNQHRRADPK